jgi:hypothetical protein
MERKAITACIGGHSHHDQEGILRGLDPDKAAGGAPMFSIFEQSNDFCWKRQDYAMPDIEPSSWNPKRKEEFKNNLGLSTMWEELEALDFSIKNNIKHVELRMGLEYSPKLKSSLAEWRNKGGKTLSLHLSDLVATDDNDTLKKYAELALDLGCNRVTLHVPKITAADFEATKNVLLDRSPMTLKML